MKEKICVIIRVYNRIQDIECNLEIIRKTWTNNDYYVIVSCNGEQDGYSMTEKIQSLSDKIVKNDGNSGHLQGNSLLLLQALPYIPSDCEYTLLLEADTWLYQDKLICKYIKELKAQKAVWASAKWYDRFHSLATDFAIVNTEFLKKNKAVLEFGIYPETYVASYIHDKGESWVHIKENEPVQIAGYIHKYPYAPFGRFYVFPFSRMVTHHVEHFKRGMDRKKRDFNIFSGNFFPDNNVRFPVLYLIWMKILVCVTLLFPRRSWFAKGEFRDEEKKYYSFE